MQIANQRDRSGRGTNPLMSPYLWMAVTIATLGFILAVTFTGVFAQDQITRGVYPERAGVTALYFLAIFGLPWAIRRPKLRVRGWLPWGAAALTLITVLGAIALWWLGRWGLGYQWIQSLKLVTAPYGWGDLKLYFDWLVCYQSGINPITAANGTCVAEQMNYGPGFLWWAPLAFLRPAMDVIGVATAVLCALAIAWLTRRSAPWGALALLIAAISPAWILLVERANFDELIIWMAILLVVLTRRYGGLWPWIFSAVLIAILGTWKYYPFAMVLALIPVLRLRRGWWVIAGFMVAALTYVAAYWNVALGGMSTHMGKEGGVGRNTLAAFPAGLATPASDFGWADAVVVVLVLSAALWGFSIAMHLPRASIVRLEPSAMLAVSGATAIFGSVMLAGSGYPYKAALLLLGVPLIAALTKIDAGVMWRTGLMLLGVIIVSVFVEWNPLTGSAAVHLGAGFVFGMSIAVLARNIPWPSHRTQPAAEADVDTHRTTT